MPHLHQRNPKLTPTTPAPTPAQATTPSSSSSSASSEPSKYAFVKDNWGSYPTFMQSYGLRHFNDDDVGEAKQILHGLMEQDRVDREQGRSSGSGFGSGFGADRH